MTAICIKVTKTSEATNNMRNIDGMSLKKRRMLLRRILLPRNSEDNEAGDDDDEDDDDENASRSPGSGHTGSGNGIRVDGSPSAPFITR